MNNKTENVAKSTQYADEWIALCDITDVAELEVIRVELEDGHAVAVYNLEGEFYVTDNLCTHGDASLSEGEVEGGNIICPYHLGSFDIKSGAPTGPPCVEPLNVYEVKVIKEQVCIRRQPVVG